MVQCARHEKENKMADGDYERGREREIGAIAAKLKRLAAARANGEPAAGKDGAASNTVPSQIDSDKRKDPIRANRV